MTTNQIVRLQSNGHIQEALRELKALREDPSTELGDVIALGYYQTALERQVEQETPDVLTALWQRLWRKKKEAVSE